MTRAALAVRSLSKRFGGQQALDGVDLVLRPGEVHGLLGENGSGKSTLIKILAGYYEPDSGQLEVGGSAVQLPLAAGQAQQLGLEFVHQDLGLITTLSVVENLTIGKLATSSEGWFIWWPKTVDRARASFARYNVTLDPTKQVSALTPVERALVAIVRAMEGLREAAEGRNRVGILVLDEPTVYLPRTDIERLFALIREIAQQGSSVLLVSHDLDEVLEITDYITVLRDGRVVSSGPTGSINKSDLVEAIVGRELETVTHAKHPSSGREVSASVSSLSGEVLNTVSFDVQEGEVLGVTGLAGSGFDELPYLLYGAQPVGRGALDIGGRHFDLTQMTPTKALAARIAMIPADRRRDGSIASLSVTDNVTLPILDTFMVHFALRRRMMVARAAELMVRFGVRPRNPQLSYGSLSGGNQQRALLAKWLQVRPRVLLLHEPTQGVDVGARDQIFTLIRSTASAGTAVMCASSDYEQLAIICDRVLVFAKGRIVSELGGASVSKERITEQCYRSMEGWTADVEPR